VSQVIIRGKRTNPTFGIKYQVSVIYSVLSIIFWMIVLTVIFSDGSLQLCDLAGAAQTIAVHQAVKKTIRLDGEADFDAAERYLWALSMGSHPVPEVVRGSPQSFSITANYWKDGIFHLLSRWTMRIKNPHWNLLCRRLAMEKNYLGNI